MITAIAAMALMSPAQLAAQPEPACVVASHTQSVTKQGSVNGSTNFTYTGFGAQRSLDDSSQWD